MISETLTVSKHEWNKTRYTYRYRDAVAEIANKFGQSSPFTNNCWDFTEDHD